MFLGRFPIFDISVNGKYTNVCKVDAAITSWIGIALLYTWSPQHRHSWNKVENCFLLSLLAP